MNKSLKMGLAILSLSTLTSLSFAATTGAYVGGGLGGSRLETSNNFLFPKGSSDQSRQIGGLGGRVFGGYNFNQYVGVEAGLAHYAQSKYDSRVTGFSDQVKYNMNAFDVVGKGYLPLGESGFNLYGFGGAALVNSKFENNVQFIGANHNVKKTQNKVRPIVGIGASYDIPQTNLTTNLEYSHIQGTGNTKITNGLVNSSAIPNADMVTLNLAYNFG